MHYPHVQEAFADPVLARKRIIRSFRHRLESLPERGSSFFIHLSELCPVACEHCMYSSDLERKSEKVALSRSELEGAIRFISESSSQKLNITGGGEPFLKLSSILRLLETVDVPRIEIVTAGHWATTPERTARIMGQLDAARSRNPRNPELLLRLSIDRYHLNAPRPVRIEHYGNVLRCWSETNPHFAAGLRSIQPDMGIVDLMIAEELGAEIQEVDDWNRILLLPAGGSVPITFNVFRRSGKALRLAEDHRGSSKTLREYYGPFEKKPGNLSLATAVNDAIRGDYTATSGLAVTLNSDGTFWIFCGTAPDRKLLLGEQNFAEAVAYFFEDPLTHLLVDEGIWALSDLVLELDPTTHSAALAKNDSASLVDDLLAPDDVRLAATLIATQDLVNHGRATVDPEHPLATLLSDPGIDLARICRDTVRQSGTAR
ncbi:4Fe-4S cluster-binding domain-containing protein [Streptomyces sp. NPDC005963]|uniref:4Fe-4S cluster-binding domain-containing protein n=1 Tax=Streptomyces sp. NPDC005963 TaxID=3156721 RepID=UPI0033C60510